MLLTADIFDILLVVFARRTTDYLHRNPHSGQPDASHPWLPNEQISPHARVSVVLDLDLV